MGAQELVSSPIRAIPLRLNFTIRTLPQRLNFPIPQTARRLEADELEDTIRSCPSRLEDYPGSALPRVAAGRGPLEQTRLVDPG